MRGAGRKLPIHVDVWRYHDSSELDSFPPLAHGPEATQVLAVQVTFRKGHGTELAADLADLSRKAGLSASSDDTHYAVGPGVDYSALIGATVTILGAAGGIGGIAAVLKVFFERHNGKKVTFGEAGHVLEVQGLSAEEIIRLLVPHQATFALSTTVRRRWSSA